MIPLPCLSSSTTPPCWQTLRLARKGQVASLLALQALEVNTTLTH